MARSAPRLGKVQLQIMQVLWRLREATAREITDELCRQKPTAHGPVQTLLRELEGKGAVGHEVRDRTFIFRPLFREDEVARTATRELLDRVFDGSIYGMVSHLLTHENVSTEELAQLRRLLEEEAGS